MPVLEKMPVATVKGNRVPSQEAAQPYGGVPKNSPEQRYEVRFSRQSVLHRLTDNKVEERADGFIYIPVKGAPTFLSMKIGPVKRGERF